jgi:hypothetical protein
MYDQAARFIVEHKYQEAFFKRTYKNTAPSPVDGMILEAVGNIKDRDYTDTWGEKGIGPPVVALKLQEIVHKIEQDAVAECERNLISFSRDYDIQHGELLHAQTGTDGASCPRQAWRACWALTLGRVYSLYKPTSRCNAMHSVCGRRQTRQQCSLKPLKLAWPVVECDRELDVLDRTAATTAAAAVPGAEAAPTAGSATTCAAPRPATAVAACARRGLRRRRGLLERGCRADRRLRRPLSHRCERGQFRR